MSDKELLELAAKAAGIEFTLWHGKPAQTIRYGNPAYLVETRFWNPRDDDGDALRLAVKLAIEVSNVNLQCMVIVSGWQVGEIDAIVIKERHAKDPYAATRRAIVRAAAEIGKAMP